MSNVSAASVGGAAGASGVGFQNRVFGWAAAALLAEEPLPISLVVGQVVGVGAQMGFEVDDVCVLTDVGHWAVFQAKVHLTLSAAADSALAKGLDQAVRMYLNGQLPVAGGVPRAVTPNDRIVLCTDPSAPQTVRVHVTQALERFACQPAGSNRAAGLNAPELKAFNVAAAHIERSWTNLSGTPPALEEMRTFCACLRVLTLDLDGGRADQQVAVSMLDRTLSSSLAGAWLAVVDVAQQASVDRVTLTRHIVVEALAHRGVWVKPPSRYAEDIETVRARSAKNLEAFSKDACLPVPGAPRISRTAADALIADMGRTNVLVVGDAGAGKSAVAHQFAAHRAASEDVVVLRANDIAGKYPLQLDNPLADVLAAWAGPSGVIIVDGVDALRGSEDRQFLSELVGALVDTRWQVVASVRSFDARNSERLRAVFTGTPLCDDTNLVERGLEGVRHVRVGDLSDDDLDSLKVEPLAHLLASAAPELRRLLRNPFNLRLAAELVAGGDGDGGVSVARTRTDLLQRYWATRVADEDRVQRGALLRRVVEAMVAGRQLEVVEAEPVIQGADAAALDAALSCGVLTASEGLVPGGTRSIGFSHNILFDYATTVYLLHSPQGPAQLIHLLDRDPSLPLIVRPSFDLLMDFLWPARTQDGFWPVMFAVSEAGHVLASLAFMAGVVGRTSDPDDLLPLAKPDGTETPGKLPPRLTLVGHLVGVAWAETVVPDLSVAAPALSRLAEALASNAAKSFADAAWATDLLRVLRFRAPLRDRTKDEAEVRGRTIAELLDTSRSDSVARERVAGGLVQELRDVIAVSADARAAAARMAYDDTALKQWGGTVLRDFPELFAAVLRVDPALARTLAVTAVTFKEVRDESVAFGGSAVLPMNESRRQQAEGAWYALERVFPGACATNLVTSAQVVCDIFGVGDEDDPDDDSRFPLEGFGAQGWMKHEYGFGLGSLSHDKRAPLLRALSTALSEAQNEDAEAALAYLVQHLHDGGAWATLMTKPTDAGRLCEVLWPLFASGTLLTHSDTAPNATVLLKAGLAAGSVDDEAAEAAVTEAVRILDATKRFEARRNVVIGCLRPGTIRNPDFAQIRASLGESPPELPSEGTIIGGGRPWSPVDEFPSLSPRAKAAGTALAAAINQANNSSAGDEIYNALLEAFAEGRTVFAQEPNLPAPVAFLTVDAAHHLARFAANKPGTDTGNAVLEELLNGSANPEAGQFLE